MTAVRRTSATALAVLSTVSTISAAAAIGAVVALGGIGAVATLAGCQAPDPPPIACAHRAECPPGWTCGAEGVCIVATDCDGDRGCCPGLSCFNGHCEPDPACAADEDCPGGACREGLCGAPACAGDGDCQAPGRCVAGVCAKGLPCPACEAGDVCVPEVGRCMAAVGACAISCADGMVRVAVDSLGALAGPGCDVRDATCACAPLPALAEGVSGFWGALVGLGPLLLHTSYDTSWGDVVVSRYEVEGATATRVEGPVTVDGLPATAPVEGDPAGPRGGVASPGPDVGRYLAATGHGSFLYLAYRSDTQRALRFAVVKPDKGFASVSYTLAAEGDPGTHVAVAADAAGIPRVASLLADRGDVEGGRRTALGLWVAARSNPSSPEDWSAVRVLTEAVVPPDPDADAFDAPSRGAGLFPSIAVDQNAVTYVAFHDSTTGSLQLARSPLSGPATITVVDGTEDASAQGATAGGRVGPFARLALLPSGAAAIAYQDATDHVLRYWSGPPGAGTVEIADDGAGHRVGAGIALALTASGQPIIVHGDETTGDLRLTRRAPEGWTTQPLLADGVQGLFPSLTRLDGGLWASALELRFPDDATPAHVLHVLPVP